MASFTSQQQETVSWEGVPSAWKDGNSFDREVLAQVFPGKVEEAGVRSKEWRAVDGNGSGKVSLAEFDSYFNAVTGSFERKHGVKMVNHKSKLYVYARPCLIRAFALANGVAPAADEGDDDYVTRSEFRLLLVATQCALLIFRLFDIADTSKDRRVSKREWHANLEKINAELGSFGYQGPPMTDDDFAKVDHDGGGHILLDEAVYFFLEAFTSDPNLLRENDTAAAAA